jgi:putative hydrolase of the HAD superfamily
MKRAQDLTQVKAVLADYLGTLVNARTYSLDASMLKLHGALAEAGFETSLKEFLEAYARAHEKYRVVRYGELREVTNAVWVSETLCSLGYEVSADDPHMKAALNVFFQDFIDSLELREYAEKLVKKTAETCKLGLVSNFTYAPVVHFSLRKLGLSQFFNAVVVSGDVGWRKPHKRIFKDALERLQVEAGEAVYVGDSPLEDIKGAEAAGIRTVFVPSQFNNLVDLHASGQKPNCIVVDLKELYRNFSKIVTC